MAVNWTFDHDDYSPFGSDEHISTTEHRSFLITIFFSLIGLFGNLILLIGNGYILRHSMDGEKRTFENFLVEMSCFDSIVLLYHLINAIVRYKASPNSDIHTMTGLINISAVCCKLLTYIVRVSTLMSHWLIVLLLLNRLFLVYPTFYRLIAIVNAKYAVLALVFIFTFFNVLPIESISYNVPMVFLSNSTTNITLYRHCLMNAEMVDLEASIYSTAVIINVFFYTGIGLMLPTVIICFLSILIFHKGAHLWKELHSHHSQTENISLRSNSPIVEYLRTYNAAFTLGIIFLFLSIPCKLLRLIVLFASNNTDEPKSSRHILFQAHAQMQTVGHAFELSLYSYKCFIFICTNRRFRCALKYLVTYHRSHVLIDQHRPSTNSSCGHKEIQGRHSQESVPFEGLYRHLQINEFEPTINMYSTGVPAELYSYRSSFKTRLSVSSRRTKEDEISL
ncbi:unnamed protein product [Rotaria socialis]|uniref:G-protein coupled receptors family 1 profile domain-containing protein n=1 Tax=Rotaria socialis TaxID=392032 RepID=A0A817S3T5_9BILA|nr:unnamed protein product [Rotaria socialis]CAF3296338.1 unnamed protein product [Rotaria socialis]CAF3505006.1 unnamed protein product [Rotaria socialis]CAF4310315.1 unnamed protein product [Rotaria socialis]CAF4431590.1 unnamed protein product [Rotaria socialis]